MREIISAGSFVTAELAEIERACFSDPWSQEALGSHLESACGVTLICREDGITAGYLAGILLPPESELYRVAVLPAYRRRGIGDALLLAFLDLAKGAGCETDLLEVRASNVAALSLYERTGYQRISIRKQYYRHPTEDAIILMKGL